MKTLLKTVRREIRNSPGRFFAIFAITALGVGFLAGLLSTAPDLYNSVDTYYDNSAFMDFNIKSTGGLTKGDLEALKNSDAVANAYPAKVGDAEVRCGDFDDCVARIYGVDMPAFDDKDSGVVNRTELVEGRYPENDKECLAVFPNGLFEPVKTGSVITFEQGKGVSLSESELTVVGLVNVPVYMSIEKESTTIGNGRITLVLFTYEELFGTDYYTDIFLTADGAEELNTFYPDYEELRDNCADRLKELAESREDARFEELKGLAVEAALATPEGQMLSAIGNTDELENKAMESVERPEWYILDRDTNASFVSISSNAEKVDAIAKVFPIFFFLVAALVALTTMTRMVDEERVDIGTLKALGYSNSAIAAKFLTYSGLATVTGGVIGLAAGLIVLPKVIINAYSIMYRLPPILLSFNAAISITAISVAVVCVLAATLYTVLSDLHEAPASLMLPKAPKNGKRILLESVGFIWNRMKFTHKVTARNLFRYKKRFFMTVIGICGCTALLLTGFGLKDAISDVVDKQYNDIQKYNLTVQLADESDRDAAEDFFKKNSNGYLETHTENGSITDDGKEYEINIYVPSVPEKFSDYMNLRERKSGKEIVFDNDSVIVTEKFAANHSIRNGSTITLENADGDTADIVVTGICENYIYSYVYISPVKYESVFNKNCEFTTLLADFDTDTEDTAMTEMLAYDSVASAAFSSSITTSFNNMIDKINYIVIVLIISAGLLAFIVLYNLTNINIGERQKEIATIKVLGFYDGEVNDYIYRETFILSLIGTAVGLIAGIFLCRFVVLTAEVDIVMFGRTIYPLSFVLSAVITLVFTAMVNLAMARKLKRIDMVESMKSVD